MQFCVRDRSVEESQVKYPVSLHIYKGFRTIPL